MGDLTTHILDTASGRPAAGVAVRIYAVEDEARRLLAETHTNADGRCDGPLLSGDAFRAGKYRIEFDIADYYRTLGADLPNPAFIDVAVIEFGVSDPGQKHHIPLLAAPYGYTTYRGS